MKFEKTTESGIAHYMKTRECDRETAIADLIDVGVGRVAALDKHSKKGADAKRPRSKRAKKAE